MTILEAIKQRIEMPKEVWDFKVWGPSSFDDELVISAMLKRTEKSKPIWFKIKVKDFDLEINKSK